MIVSYNFCRAAVSHPALAAHAQLFNMDAHSAGNFLSRAGRQVGSLRCAGLRRRVAAN